MTFSPEACDEVTQKQSPTHRCVRNDCFAKHVVASVTGKVVTLNIFLLCEKQQPTVTSEVEDNEAQPLLQAFGFRS